MSITGIKSSETILGSQEWRFEKLENFASTFWTKPTFNTFFEYAIFNQKLLNQSSASGKSGLRYKILILLITHKENIDQMCKG